MEKELFSPLAIDAIGEMMNISLGSSATAVSNMLDHRVDITTPQVSVVQVNDFTLGNLEPAMGVEIKYVSGLEGSNIMLLKRSDIKVIVDILMGMETPDDEFELNELTVSAVCEVMNQMMGAASTALSDFLGRMVNISTPQSFELSNLETFKQEHFPQGVSEVVVVRFALRIEGALESEFMNVMTVDLAKELVAGFGLGEDEEVVAEPVAPAPPPQAEPASGGGTMSQEEIERMMSSMGASPAPSAPPASGGGGTMSQEEIERMMASMGGGGAPGTAPQSPAPPGGGAAQMPPAGQMPGYPPFAGGYMGYPPMYYPPYPYPPEKAAAPPEPKVINAQPMPMPHMDAAEALGAEQAQNLELIMEVPLEVTVEIGRTRRKVQDILAFSKGALVVLDKLAGDQVDLFVNGKCIAKGDVVVIDDNFGIRITEILQKPTIEGIAKK